MKVLNKEEEHSEDSQLDLLERPTFIVEANFLNAPIFNFDKCRKSKQLDAIHYEFIENAGTEGSIVKSVAVTVGKRLDGQKMISDCLPGNFDHDVWLVIMDLWHEQGSNPSGRVFFKMIDLCIRLQITSSGGNYKLLKESISRLARTTVEFSNAYYSKKETKFRSATISLLNEVHMVSMAEKRSSSHSCWVEIGKTILENLKGNYSASINRKMYQQLKAGYSKRLLNLVAYKQQIEKNPRGSFEFDLEEVFKKLPISGKYYPSKAIERLKPSLNELQKTKAMNWEIKTTKNKRKVLLLSPLEDYDPLIGEESITRFISLQEKVYGTSVNELFGLSVRNIIHFLKDYKKTVECDHYGGRNYSKVFLVLDIHTFQVVRDKKTVRHDLQYILGMLKSDQISYPVKYIPVDVQYDMTIARERLIEESSKKEAEEKEARLRLREMAESYLQRLTPEEKSRYNKLFAETHPEWEDSVAEEDMLWTGCITELILKDMKLGNKIDLIPLEEWENSKQQSNCTNLEFSLDEVGYVDTKTEYEEDFSHALAAFARDYPTVESRLDFIHRQLLEKFPEGESSFAYKVNSSTKNGIENLSEVEEKIILNWFLEDQHH